MTNLINFALIEEFKKISSNRRGLRLEEMKSHLDWDKFLAMLPERDSTRGRPPYERLVMVRLLFLQSCHGISDEELEFQVKDRVSFRSFLEFPDTIPDYSTVWRFREELAEDNILEKLWAEFQRQLDEKKIEVKKGYIQDATFIVAEPGKQKSSSEPRGKEAKTSRSKDGTWTKKGSKSFFGFKAHVKVQKGSKFIKELAITSAKVHDGAVDLANPDDLIYRDRGYSGIKTHARGDGTMKRGKLNIHQKLRNKRISKQRAEGEHPFGIIARSLKGGKTKLTTIYRVYVQQAFVCMAYNLHRLKSLSKLA